MTSDTGGNTFPPDPSFQFDSPQTHPKHKKTHRVMGLFVLVGLPGIEPGLYAPEAHVLPVYYSPSLQKLRRGEVRLTGIA